MKRSRRNRTSIAHFHDAVVERDMCCFFIGHGCSGRLTGHHVIEQQRLSIQHGLGHFGDYPLELVLNDPRNGIALCRAHHAAIGLTFRIERAHLPSFVEAFAADMGLGWSLDRDYGERERAA